MRPGLRGNEAGCEEVLMKFLTLALALCAGLWAADVPKELMEADRAFDAATAARGLDGWMSYFADDARINQQPKEIVGKAALREFYSAMFARKEFSIRWQPVYAEASQDGTLGYTYGVSQVSFRDGKGEMVKREGRYLTVWRKQKDGSWKVSTDIGN
jgi:ketosteroid isomerase-like protein